MNSNSRTSVPSPANRIDTRRFSLSTIVDAYDHPAVFVDRSGLIVYANRLFTRQSQLPPSEIAGQDWFETCLPQHLRQVIRQAFEDAEFSEALSLQTVPALKVSPVEGERSFNWHTVIFRSEIDGTLEGFLATLEDITFHCQTASLLRENTRRLEQAEAIAKLGHWEFHIPTGDLYWSDQVYRIFEIDPSQFRPSYLGLLGLVHPDDRNRIDSTFQDALRTGLPYDFEHRLLMPDGRIKFVQERGETTYAPDGSPLRTFGTLLDVTRQKEVECSLQLKNHAIEAAFTAIAFADIQGVLTYVNAAFAEKWGFEDPSELVGLSAIKLYADPEAALEVLAEVQTTGRFRGDLEARRRDGSTFISSICADLIRDEKGNPSHIVGWITDVTEKRHAEAELAREQKFTKTVLNNSPICIKTVDREGRFLTINTAGVRMLGAANPEDILALKIWDVIDPRDWERLTTLHAQVWEGRSDCDVFRVKNLLGRESIVQSHYTPLRDDNDRIIAALSVSMDVTQQQQDADNLQESRGKIAAILAQLPVTMFSYDMEGTIQMVEGMTLQNLGFKPAEILRKNVFHVYRKQTHIIEAVRGALAGNSTITICEHSPYTFEVRQTPMRDAAGNQTGVISLVIDVTEQAAAARQLADTTVHLKTMFDAMSEGVVVVDSKGIMTEVNPSAERIFAIPKERLIGRDAFSPACNRYHEDGTPFLAEELPAAIALRTGLPQRESVMGLNLEKGRIWISIDAEPMIRAGETRPFAVIVTFSDITLRKELDERDREIREKLTHALRINMLGEMSAGLAHELNQPLTAIATYAFVAQGTLSGPQPSNLAFKEAQQLLGKITEESIRAGEIIKRLRNLVRNRQAQAVACNFHELIDEVVSLLDYEIRTLGIQITRDFGPTPLVVLADRVQTQQVFMNLLRNAIDSIKQAPDRIPGISLMTRACEKNAGKIIARVTDNGPGIPPELRQRIFEPYLSTKAEGLGLGLPISRTIVESQGGTLELIESLPGRTTFQFSLRTTDHQTE
ncbi:MAG: PAS domain S-box protein [Planctomycetales bacterium]